MVSINYYLYFNIVNHSALLMNNDEKFIITITNQIPIKLIYTLKQAKINNLMMQIIIHTARVYPIFKDINSIDRMRLNNGSAKICCFRYKWLLTDHPFSINYSDAYGTYTIKPHLISDFIIHDPNYELERASLYCIHNLSNFEQREGKWTISDFKQNNPFPSYLAPYAQLEIFYMYKNQSLTGTGNVHAECLIYFVDEEFRKFLFDNCEKIITKLKNGMNIKYLNGYPDIYNE